MNPPGAAIIHNQSGHFFCTGGVMLCVAHGSRFLRQGRTTTESGRNTLLRTRTGDPFLAAARQSDKQLWLKDDDPVTSPHFFINLGRPVQGFSSSKRRTCAPPPGDQHDMSTPAGNGQLDDMVVAGAQPDKLVGMRPGWAALAIICEGLKADNPQCQKNDHQRRKKHSKRPAERRPAPWPAQLKKHDPGKAVCSLYAWAHLPVPSRLATQKIHTGR